jgi:hypothetical protein
MSISWGKSKSSTNQKSQTDPWDVTIPLLQTGIGDLGELHDAGIMGPTGDQLDAYSSLKTKAAAGNPYAGQIDNLTNELFGYQSHAPQVQQAYTTLQDQIGGIARGDNLDPAKNPYIAQMMKTVGDDISNRIKQQFAGSGRDITGNAAGQQALGRGVSAGITPILAQFFNEELNRQGDAARTLYTAGTGAATTSQDLDRDALSTNTSGIDASNAALAARDQGENLIINLDQQLKQMPFEDLSMWLSQLLPIAGLGSQSTGNSTTKGSSMGLGVKLI